MDYRVYLFRQGHICAADVILNKTEEEARDLSEALYEACSDTMSGFELWCGTQRVAQRFGEPAAKLSVHELSHDRQQLAAELEESLQASFAVISLSRKLLERKNHLDTCLRSAPGQASHPAPVRPGHRGIVREQWLSSSLRDLVAQFESSSQQRLPPLYEVSNHSGPEQDMVC